VPHAGFALLKKWGERMAHGYASLPATWMAISGGRL
jgi:hypothetical protein